MAAFDTSLDHWINQAIAAHLRPSLSLDDCERLAALAREAAQWLGVPIVFSLVDASGQPRIFFSMDNALLIAHTLATQKAWTAVALQTATHQLTTRVEPGGDLYGLESGSDLCCVGGGFPCWSGGYLLGGIGVSGGSVEEDMLIARQAMARFSTRHYALAETR